jgi:hypothetical protein
MLAKNENPERVLQEIKTIEQEIETLRRESIHLFASNDERTAQVKQRIEKEIRQLEQQRATLEVRLTSEADRLRDEGQKALDGIFRQHAEYSDSLRAFERLIRELQNLHAPGRERAQTLLDLKAATRLKILQSNIDGLALAPLP